MHRLTRLAAGMLVAGTITAAGMLPARTAWAQNGPKLLTIGATPLFLIRVGDTLNGREWTIQDRISHIQDVYAKYLGGQYGKFTWKKWGDRVHIYLNGEFVLAVTPADARATHHKSAETLAPIWIKGLEKAFDQGHTHSTSDQRQ